MTSLVPSKRPPTASAAINERGGAQTACAMLGRHGDAIAQALRRAVPFFTRRGVHVVPDSVDVLRASDLLEGVERPTYTAQLAADPGGSRAALVLDGHAMAFLLEGVLGGDGRSLPTLDPKGLTPPQRAFVARVTEHMVGALSTAMTRALGLRLTRLPDPGGEKMANGSLVSLRFELVEPDKELGENRRCGRIVLALSKHALLSLRSHRTQRPKSPDERLIRTLEQTPIELVAELGRISISVRQLTTLAIGDTLRLGVPVKSALAIRVDGRVLLKGHPTTLGNQLAMRILERHDQSAGADRGGPAVPAATSSVA